jgi:transposase-like protein
MSRLPTRGAEFWATVVAEARKGAIPRVDVAAKHGVSEAALKYHLYKSTGSAAVKGKALALLPVRVSGTPAKQVELEFGAGLRLRFEEGCDPVYVAAVVCRLR